MFGFSYLDLKVKLLTGAINATALETLMANTTYRAAWQLMCTKRFTIRSVTASATAMAIIAGSTLASTDLVNANEGRMAVFQSGAAIKAVLDSTAVSRPIWASAIRFAVNTYPGIIKLKRQIFTASGTWTYPAHVAPGALVDARGFAVGGGGASASNNGTAPIAGGSGGGGEVKAAALATASITGNLTITVGASATASSIGALLTAAAGGSGSAPAAATGGTGGGAASSGACYDTAFLTAFWQDAFNAKGGNGKTGGSSTAGDNCTSATGQVIGTGGAATLSASAGLAYGGGGGAPGGGVGAGGVGPANSGAGGGGNGTSSSGTTTQAGGTGLVIMYWIEP